MKNTVKKAIALSAGLAGAAVMVSCEGDDVTVREVTTSVDTTGLEAAVAANNGNLPVAAPSAALFSISTLNMVVDQGVDAFVAGNEYDFEFDSTSFGSVRGIDIQGFSPSRADRGELLTVSNWTSAGTTLTMDLSADTIPFALDGVELTFTSSLQNTLLGTWTADGGRTITLNVASILVDGSDNSTLVEVTGQDSDVVQGYRATADRQPIFRDAELTIGNGVTLQDGEEAVLYEADADAPVEFQGRSVVFFRVATAGEIAVTPADLNAILADATSDNEATRNAAVLEDGETPTADFQVRVLATESNQQISGTFSMDIEASNGQTNTEAGQAAAPAPAPAS